MANDQKELMPFTESEDGAMEWIYKQIFFLERNTVLREKVDE
jgi:hypothetical protein